MTHHEDEELTHHIPMALQRKLVDAKEWYDRREPCGVGIKNLDDYNREGADLLDDIVEMCDRTWPFAPREEGK